MIPAWLRALVSCASIMLEMAQVNFFSRSELIRYVSKKFTNLNRIEILINNNMRFFLRCYFSSVGFCDDYFCLFSIQLFI